MNSAEVGVDSFGKINIQPIGRLKIPAYAAEKLAQVFYWHPICALSITKARLFTAITD